MSFSMSVFSNLEVEAAAYDASAAEKFQRQDYQGAIKDLDQAILLNSKEARFYCNRGNAKCLLGKYQAGIFDFDKAILLNPEEAEFYDNRGNAKYDFGKYREDYYRENPRFFYQAAISDYDDAIRLNSEEARFYYNRGNAKCKLYRSAEAIVDIVAIHKLAHLNPETNIDIKFTVFKDALFNYLILLPDDEGKPLLQECLDKTTVLGKVMWKRKGLFECNLESGTLKKIVDYLNPSPSQVNVTLQSSGNSSGFFAFVMPKHSTPPGGTQGLNPVADARLHPL